MNEGSSGWAQQLLYFILTKEFAADWGKAIVPMDGATLPAKAKHKLRGYMKISLFHELWR